MQSQQDDSHRERHTASHADWLRHRAILDAYRVRAGDRRTTPLAAHDMREIFPELAGRSTTAVRLHPRYGDEPAADESKLGGTFLWPAAEAWPTCPAHGVPLVTVLQLRADDFPGVPFPPEADLFQMLWCPREHGDVPACRDMPCPMSWADPRFLWRDSRAVIRPRADNPEPVEPHYEYVPFPCRLMPERVIEYPSVYELPDGLVDRIYEWEERVHRASGKHCSYERSLSVAPGTKVGGYLDVIQSWWAPACRCGRQMEHLLTVATVEWDGIVDERWTPHEEQDLFGAIPDGEAGASGSRAAIIHAHWIPTGLHLGDGGHMQVFVCRHCPDRPIVPSIECC